MDWCWRLSQSREWSRIGRDDGIYDGIEDEDENLANIANYVRYVTWIWLKLKLGFMLGKLKGGFPYD